jgi:hypothetical protein
MGEGQFFNCSSVVIAELLKGIPIAKKKVTIPIHIKTLAPNQAKLDLNMAAITARSFFAPAASCRESNYTNTHNHMLKNGAL